MVSPSFAFLRSLSLQTPLIEVPSFRKAMHKHTAGNCQHCWDSGDLPSKKGYLLRIRRPLASFAILPDEWHDDVAELVNELVTG